MILKLSSTNLIQNYSKIYPYVKPYWIRALIAVLITISIGSMDAVIAWSLKPYMDVVMLEQQTTATQTILIPLLIIVFSSLQSLLNYTATYTELTTALLHPKVLRIWKTTFENIIRYIILKRN